MKFVRFVVLILILAGAINWGLWGAFQYDLVQDIFGSMSWLSRFVYILIGLSGIYGLSFIFSKGICGFCKCDNDKCDCEKK
ncbi:MAG: DUF378 domain-containing protein [Parachlamydiales bacterium]|jgi:hypothetical protein